MGAKKSVVDELFAEVPFRPSPISINTVAAAYTVYFAVSPVVIDLVHYAQYKRDMMLFAAIALLLATVQAMKYTFSRRQKYVKALAAWIDTHRPGLTVADIEHEKKITVVDAIKHIKQTNQFFRATAIAPVVSILFMFIHLGCAWGLFYGAVVVLATSGIIMFVLNEMRMMSRKSIVHAIELNAGYSKSQKQKYTREEGRPHVIYTK